MQPHAFKEAICTLSGRHIQGKSVLSYPVRAYQVIYSAADLEWAQFKSAAE